MMATSSAMTPTADAPRGSARERLLAAAGELFYAEGVLSVGIDRVIEKAGVAKASLYNTFGSKDGLIAAYLEQRHSAIMARITRALDRYDNPRDKLLAIFEAQDESMHQPTYRGCAFVNASAETHNGSVIETESDAYRSGLRELTADLARQLGVGDPVGLARQLMMLYDGASVCARMDRNLDAALAARATAEVLLDAALAR